MQPQLHKLPLTNDNSFLYTKWRCDYFNKPWHFHDEYELVLIEKSNGIKFVGDKVSNFTEGDLLLIGPNIPHFFQNDIEYFKKDRNLEASSIFIHFKENFLGEHFFDLPEMILVRNLLIKSRFVLEIHGNTKKYIISTLHRMFGQSPPNRLISLLDILIKISESEETTSILSSKFEETQGQYINKIKMSNRINTIFEYVTNNFHRKIYVNEIASILNMSVTSFSRYFKHCTRKPFSIYLIEIRISYACKLLIQTDLSISQICFESGFENLSNFYKFFKKIMGVVPKEYRSRFYLHEQDLLN